MHSASCSPYSILIRVHIILLHACYIYVEYGLARNRPLSNFWWVHHRHRCATDATSSSSFMSRAHAFATATTVNVSISSAKVTFLLCHLWKINLWYIFQCFITATKLAQYIWIYTLLCISLSLFLIYKFDVYAICKRTHARSTTQKKIQCTNIQQYGGKSSIPTWRV